MKIAIHSDLHLEGNSLPKNFGSNQKEVELVILAGDIGVKNLNQNLLDIRNVYKSGQPILFVAGNHEWYGFDILEHNQVVKEICQKNGITFLNRIRTNTGVKIDDYFFCGTTGWSDMSSLRGYADENDKLQAQMGISDFYYIKNGDNNYTVDDMISLSKLEKRMIEQTLQVSQMLGGIKPVIITHFPPLLELRNPVYYDGALTSYFHNDWSDLIDKYQPHAWIYGHTHYNSPVKCRGKTLLLSNQRGYNKEPSNAVYNPSHIIEI